VKALDAGHVPAMSGTWVTMRKEPSTMNAPGVTRPARAIAIVALLAAGLAACTGGDAGSSAGPAATDAPPEVTPMPSPAGSRDLILATTTSTQDSGLLDVLVPAFSDATGYNVKTVAVGSGEALKLGEDGNADVLLVHSPAAEKELVANGFGIDRTLVMHNSFLVVGPAADPAAIDDTTVVADAFTKIAEAQANFASRADDSGTNTKELGYWKKAGITPEGSWYIETGQGMAATLRIASEKAAYTLTDRATWLATKDQVQLAEMVIEDPTLLNPYSVILVNPEKYPKVNAAGARAFADFLLSEEGQTLIGEFGVEEYGEQLFVPDGGKTESDLGL
jgi:tungstate transport system substrate-binding protein